MLDRPVLSARRPAAHLAAALVSVAAVALLPLAWMGNETEPGLAAWWPAALTVVAAALAYATITAMLHGRLARHPQFAASRVEPWVDAVLALECGALLWRGADSRVLLAGLPLVPPVLATVAGVSLVVLLLDWLQSRRGQSRPHPTMAFSWRLLAAIALIAAIAWLESHALPASGARAA